MRTRSRITTAVAAAAAAAALTLGAAASAGAAGPDYSNEPWYPGLIARSEALNAMYCLGTYAEGCGCAGAPRAAWAGAR